MAAITVEQAYQLALNSELASQLGSAEAMYRQILQADPRHAATMHRLGMVANATGRSAEAAEWIFKAIAQSPAQAAYHADLGVVFRYLDRLDEAMASYGRAVELQPDFAEAHNNLGEAMLRAGRCPEAVTSCRRALELRPDYAAAHNNLGTAYLKMRRPDDALASYRRALERQPDHADTHKNLVVLFAEMDRWDEAIASGQRAVALQPLAAECHLNLGVAFRGRGEFARAMDCFRQAIACQPDFVDGHWNLACLLLLLDQHEEGWREYEWRWRFPALARSSRVLSQPRWTGAPAPGETILVHAEQGYGDTMQFLRYLPLVRQRAGAGRVLLKCPAALRRLITQSGGWDAEIIDSPPEDTASLPPFDQQVPLLGLPLALSLCQPGDPAVTASPYLQADPADRLVWRERMGGPPAWRIGLAWQGNPLHANDAHRSIPWDELIPILQMAEINFFILHLESGLLDPTPQFADFADTAALMAELDLIITVDTATAHLAGALGRPVWTLLPFVPDWRWGLGRDDTPWYPTMRLFRQITAGDWNAVILRVAAELQKLTASPAPAYPDVS
jgi:tetratricopeptide (TPR) repeat protein